MKTQYWLLLICLVGLNLNLSAQGVPRSGLDEVILHTWKAEESFSTFMNRFEGKVVYVDVWASWCIPCRHEFEYSRELKKEMANEDVIFLYINVDLNSGQWERAIEKFDLMGHHLSLNSSQRKSFQDEYGVKGYPTYLLFDRSGKLKKKDAPWPSQGKTKKAIRKLL
ncbi:MAG: TlpA disulfide reductase family protein [Bacteroidota bacterium]